MQGDFTPSGAAFAHFVANLPRQPQATNDFRRDGLYRQAQADALGSRYIQPDRPYQAAWLKLDIDRVEACAAWIDQGLPAPHFMVGNPRNGHGHLLYGLQTPIVTSLGGHLAPLKYMASVEAGFTRLLGADPAYSGHTVKTPHHPSWFTRTHDGALYSLSDLLRALPASVSTRQIPRVEYVGNSRNLALFDGLRYWAYGEVKAAKAGGDYGKWEQAVHAHAHALNAYAHPLPVSEVRSTARSVARYAWRNADRLAVSVLGGVKRSKVKSWNRPEMSGQEGRERMADAAERTNAMRRNRTFDAITGAIAELTAQGIVNPTVTRIAQTAGVSRETVYQFRRSQAGHGN